MNPSLYPTPPSTPPIQPYEWQSEAPQPPRRKSKRPLVIVLVIMVFVAGGVGAWYLFTPKVPTCLTLADYQTFSGETLPDETPFAPTVDFYGFDIEFSEASTTYTDPLISSQISKVGEFAIQHPETSLRVNLEAIYRDDADQTTKDLVVQRTQAITDSLTKAGVNAKLITTKIKTYTPDPYDDASGDGNTVSLAITSDATCRIAN